MINLCIIGLINSPLKLIPWDLKIGMNNTDGPLGPSNILYKAHYPYYYTIHTPTIPVLNQLNIKLEDCIYQPNIFHIGYFNL